MNDFEFLLDIYGYQKREYGWVRDNVNGISQAVTIFQNNRFQMFSWYTDSDDIPKVYDTGIVTLQYYQFLHLIEIFNQYKNE